MFLCMLCRGVQELPLAGVPLRMLIMRGGAGGSSPCQVGQPLGRFRLQERPVRPYALNIAQEI